MEISDYFKDWMNVIDISLLNSTLSRLSSVNFIPDRSIVFEAFRKCDYNNLKVLFLGMDPYPQKSVATGVAFANRKDTPYNKLSPSLKVIVDSLNKYYTDLPNGEFDYSLDSWSRQGVMLLNSALTVIENKPGSHALIWRPFISKLLNNLSIKKNRTIFVLFGKQASSFRRFIESDLVIETVHPSFCSRNNELLPDIFSQIDSMMNPYDLIYWL